jgi:UDP-glucose 4-epimerase
MDYLHVADAARAILAGLQSQIHGVYEVGTGQPVRVRDIVRTLAGLVPSRRDPEFGALPIRLGQIMRACANPGPFIRDTGWRPQITFDAGLRSLVELKKAHG